MTLKLFVLVSAVLFSIFAFSNTSRKKALAQIKFKNTEEFCQFKTKFKRSNQLARKKWNLFRKNPGKDKDLYYELLWTMPLSSSEYVNTSNFSWNLELDKFAGAHADLLVKMYSYYGEILPCIANLYFADGASGAECEQGMWDCWGIEDQKKYCEGLIHKAFVCQGN